MAGCAGGGATPVLWPEERVPTTSKGQHTSKEHIASILLILIGHDLTSIQRTGLFKRCDEFVTS
jgi:hypothetical protein